MRLATALAFALSMGFTLSAQQPGCAPCLDSAAHSVLPGHVVCLSSSEMASHIAIRKPVGPPGLNEPRMRIDGVVVACLRFAPSGKVTDVSIVSGPAMGRSHQCWSPCKGLDLSPRQPGRAALRRLRDPSSFDTFSRMEK